MYKVIYMQRRVSRIKKEKMFSIKKEKNVSSKVWLKSPFYFDSTEFDRVGILSDSIMINN